MVIWFLLGVLLVPGMLGLFVIYHVLIRRKRQPADASNRINHIRLLWFALTREDEFVGQFPWLTRDEKENVTGGAE